MSLLPKFLKNNLANCTAARWVLLEPLMLLRFLCVFPLALLNAPGAGRAQQSIYDENKYKFERATKRIALIVGNANYKNFDPIKSSEKDLQLIQQLLIDKLKFDKVFAIPNEKDADTFNYLDFEKFKNEINEGDFVLFYFSGHGLTYAGDGFLVPVEAPGKMEQGDVLKNLVSITNIRQRIASRKPGFALILLDACRKIGNGIIRTPQGDDAAVEKGMPPIRGDNTDVVIAYATGPNEVSNGSSDDKPSIYTNEFAALAPNETYDSIEALLKDVRAYVILKTTSYPMRQVPSFDESSTSLARLVETPDYFERQKVDWLSALGTRNKDIINIFLMHYGTSPYAAAARQWLRENQDLVPPSTKLSAESVEAAWADQSGGPISVSRLDGPYALRRKNNVRAGNIVEEAAGITGAKLGAQIIADVGTVVLSSAVKARIAPSDTSPLVETIAKGEIVSVERVATGPKGEPWLQIPSSSGEAQVSYLPASRIKVSQTSIGTPLKEISVSPDPKLETLIDSQAIMEAVGQLRKEGKSISRVSLSVPPVRFISPTDPAVDAAINEKEKKRMIYEARLANAAYELVKAGIDRLSITSLEGNPNVGDDQLSVKFFGR